MEPKVRRLATRANRNAFRELDSFLPEGPLETVGDCRWSRRDFCGTALEGEVIPTAALADQISREFNVSLMPPCGAAQAR